MENGRNTTALERILSTIYETTEASTTTSRCQPVDEENGIWWPAIFCETYFLAHGYVALALCTYGLLSNIFTVLIFSRRGMRTPVNVLLTAIAVADSLTMLPYIPYAIYFYVIVKCVKFECASQYSAFWVSYMLASNRLFLTFHNVAIWLTVALSIIRWISVCRHTEAKTYCSMERVQITIAVVTFLGIFICIPTYLEFKVENYGNEEYWLAYTFEISESLKDVNFIVYAAILRLVPCVVMIGFCAPIIVKVQKANKVRERMKQKEDEIRRGTSCSAMMNTQQMDETEDNPAETVGARPSVFASSWMSKRNLTLRKQSTRSATKGSRQGTTVMLVTIVLFFVAVEMPIGLVCLVSGFNHYFSNNVYVYLGDLQDDLVLLNSAVNFTLYCAMSAQFRQTCQQAIDQWRESFCKIVFCCKAKKQQLRKQPQTKPKPKQQQEQEQQPLTLRVGQVQTNELTQLTELDSKQVNNNETKQLTELDSKPTQELLEPEQPLSELKAEQQQQPEVGINEDEDEDVIVINI